MAKKLSVASINNGTVIDHIRGGYALRLIKLFGLLSHDNQITVGINLPSKRYGTKDLIKVENLILNPEIANAMLVFESNITINIIQNYDVVKKLLLQMPDYIANKLICPNISCITNKELITSCFRINSHGSSIKLQCHFCEKLFERDQVNVGN